MKNTHCEIVGTDFWLHLCKISASPTGDIIALANERRLVVVSAKWDSSTSLSTFQPIYTDSIHEYDKVKAVLCLPIVGESHSSHVGPDWICIVLGKNLFDSSQFYSIFLQDLILVLYVFTLKMAILY